MLADFLAVSSAGIVALLTLGFPRSGIESWLSYRQAPFDYSFIEVSFQFIVVETPLVITDIYFVICRKPWEMPHQWRVKIIRLDPFLIIAEDKLASL